MNMETNEDLAMRLQKMEAKVDELTTLLKQVTGVWFFVKVVSSIALGVTVLYNAFWDLFTK